MSQENVELLYRWYEAFGEHDNEACVRDSAAGRGDRQLSAGGRRAPSTRGTPACAATSTRCSASSRTGTPGWCRRSTAGMQIVAEIRMAGRGAGSGLEIEQTTWQVTRFRDGKLAGFTAYGRPGGSPRGRGAVGVGDVAGERRGRPCCLCRFNARDVDGLLRLSGEDCEWQPLRAQLEGIVYRGHQGVRQFDSDMDEDWEAFRIDPLEFHDGHERVAVIGRVTALGRSGVDDRLPRGLRVSSCSGVGSGRIISHSDPEAALEAVGPAE